MQVPSTYVEWGNASIVDAERRLLAAALADRNNERFVLLSESCIPIRNLTFVYHYLFADNWYVRCSLLHRSGSASTIFVRDKCGGFVFIRSNAGNRIWIALSICRTDTMHIYLPPSVWRVGVKEASGLL